MNPSSFSRPIIAALFATAAWTFPAIAHAECATDADCGTGMICQAYDSQLCTAYACVAGQPCPPPTCETVTYHECAPKPCTTDSECGDGMVCLTQTSTSCPPQPAYDCIDPNNCPTIEPVACVLTTTSTCAPKYMAPCTVDADCGAGFNCVPEQSCTCSGGTATRAPSSADGGVAYADAGTAYPEPIPTDCTCTATGVNSCQMQVIPCTTNSECPADWSCVAYATGGGGCAVPVYPDGGTSDYTCDPAQQTTTTYSQCEPPYYNYGYGYASGGVTYFGAADSTGTTAYADAGALVPSDPTSTGTGTTGTGGSASVSPPTEGTITAGDSVDTATNAVPEGSEAHDSGGCQVGSGGANSLSGFVLAAMGLFGILRRRRGYSASP